MLHILLFSTLFFNLLRRYIDDNNNDLFGLIVHEMYFFTIHDRIFIYSELSPNKIMANYIKIDGKVKKNQFYIRIRNEINFRL